MSARATSTQIRPGTVAGTDDADPARQGSTTCFVLGQGLGTITGEPGVAAGLGGIQSPRTEGAGTTGGRVESLVAQGLFTRTEAAIHDPAPPGTGSCRAGDRGGHTLGRDLPGI